MNVEATQAELDQMPDAPKGLAAQALTLAAGLDDPRASLAMKSMAAREHRETMNRIRELAPPKRKGDAIDAIGDELASRRAERGSGSAAAKA